jgi:hypothetical protein
LNQGSVSDDQKENDGHHAVVCVTVSSKYRGGCLIKQDNSAACSIKQLFSALDPLLEGKYLLNFEDESRKVQSLLKTFARRF